MAQTEVRLMYLHASCRKCYTYNSQGGRSILYGELRGHLGVALIATQHSLESNHD